MSSLSRCLSVELNHQYNKLWYLHVLWWCFVWHLISVNSFKFSRFDTKRGNLKVFKWNKEFYCKYNFFLFFFKFWSYFLKFQSKGVVCPRQVVPYDVVTNKLPDLRVPCGAISYLSDRSRNLISVLNLLCLLIYNCNRW